MSAPILAINPGSSSLKASVRTPQPKLSVLVERVGTDDGLLVVDGDRRPFGGDLAAAFDALEQVLGQRGLQPRAVAHRVVHGGPHHFDPIRIDDRLIADLRAAIPLAPLHLPSGIDTIEHARRKWPDVPHIACFDTGFHQSLPEVSRRLPVPAELARLGVRRYGFHGLSVLSVLLARPGLGNVVVAHLGSGCSVTAVDAEGRSQHTTMSLTPTAGMMSGTRTGDLDPEIALYLIDEHGYSPAALRSVFDRQSGLAGVADGRHDVRDLLAADDHDAALALDMFARSAAMAIASCATALDRWDSLVFTGGVGEHAADLRATICARVHRPSAVGVHVVPADEELVLDRLARSVLGGFGEW